MEHLLISIALLCQTHSTSTAPFTSDTQRKCQQELAQCVFKNKNLPGTYSLLLLQCVAKEIK